MTSDLVLLLLEIFFVSGIFGIPTLIAIGLMKNGYRWIERPAQIWLITIILLILMAWQILPLRGMSVLGVAVGGGYGFLYGFWFDFGLAGLAIISCYAGRQSSRIAQAASPPYSPAFDPARSAALFAVLYAVAFVILAKTRDPHWGPGVGGPGDWLADWPPMWQRLGDDAHRLFRPGDWMADWPPMWPSVLMALAVAVGLWKRHPWAWWLGLVFGWISLSVPFDDPEFLKHLLAFHRGPLLREPPLPFLLVMVLALILPGTRPR